MNLKPNGQIQGKAHPIELIPLDISHRYNPDGSIKLTRTDHGKLNHHSGNRRVCSTGCCTPNRGRI